jgi:hypothetical protein
MNIQAKTNEELRTKLSNLREKFFMGSNRKNCSRISCCKWKNSIQNKEKEKRAAELIIITKNLLFKIKKENQTAELVVANTNLPFKMKKKKIGQLN